MKKLLVILLCLPILVLSQTRNCGTMEHLEYLKGQDPQLEQRMVQDEIDLQNRLQNQSNNSMVSSVITIPVVVHVVYNNSIENISDLQIHSQLLALNQDFRKLNSDFILVPSVFQSLGADVEVEFCLAAQDPNGIITTGITRTQTSVSSFSTNDDMKHNSTGGIDAWDTDKYLNIWVCNLSGSILGYAQFPNTGSANEDGVVCTYTAFGTNGTASFPYNLGRTLTHEVGHWLNLRHIWGDSFCGDDYCNDTPTQYDNNVGCPSFPQVTCSNGPNGDMFMNYMDYTNDVCMHMFTEDQKTRMKDAINTHRSGLLISNGCSPGLISGCMDTTACNYDPLATIDDGSCEFTSCLGCTDPTAFNYSPLATIDDGSCIYKTYVPDDNFEQALINLGYDNLLDDYVNTASIDTVISLDLSSGLGIVDLTGIEGFTALTYLNCSSNPLIGLDVSQNTALWYLHCRSNQLTSLDISNNTNLFQLVCYNNQLTSLDVSQNINLSSFACGQNQLTSLDVSNNIALRGFSFENNQLTSINVSNNTALYYLHCSQNPLTSLDVSQNINLESLRFSGVFSNIDLRNNTKLGALSVYNDVMTSIDISKCTGFINTLLLQNQLSHLSTADADNLTCIQVNDIFDANMINTLDVGPQQSFSLCCPGGILGCTNSTACNYNSLATCDDGSCILPDGCTDPLACNYDASATCDDGSCLTDFSATLGCMDSTACNYDASATCDDGSCYNNLISSISQNGETLSAVTTPIGLNADWYNIQIEGGTTRIWLMQENTVSFTPTFECSYFIVVSNDGCIDTSETYYYGANAARIGSFVTSPNPTSGLINVKFDNPNNQFVMFELISNNGTKLDEFIAIENNLDIDLSKYSSGSYYLYFNSEDAVQGCRLEELQKVSTKIILNK